MGFRKADARLVNTSQFTSFLKHQVATNPLPISAKTARSGDSCLSASWIFFLGVRQLTMTRGKGEERRPKFPGRRLGEPPAGPCRFGSWARFHSLVASAERALIGLEGNSTSHCAVVQNLWSWGGTWFHLLFCPKTCATVLHLYICPGGEVTPKPGDEEASSTAADTKYAARSSKTGNCARTTRTLLV